MTEDRDSPPQLVRRVDAALAARRVRAPETIARVLSTAAAHWAADARLAAAAATMHLSVPMVQAVAAHVRAALAEAPLLALALADAADAHGERPALVGHVLASNVPALALPAIAHACIVGAAIVLKSGRADRVSAVAYRDAIAREDPLLATTIVPAYWPGPDEACEAAAFARASPLVGTGSDETVTALTRRWPTKLVGFGDRTSVAVITRDALSALDAVAAALASDIVLYEQRGCLSPHAVFVEGANDRLLDALAGAVLEHLNDWAVRVPQVAADPTERARVRAAADEAEWAAGARVFRDAGGTVLCDPRPQHLTPIGGRTLRLQPLDQPGQLLDILPPGYIESVGAAGDITPLLPGLRRLGVSRVCRLGTMQTPPIHWPRGQHAPLALLRQAPPHPEMLVDV